MSSLKKTLKNSDGNLLIAKDEQLRKKERKENYSNTLIFIKYTLKRM